MKPYAFGVDLGGNAIKIGLFQTTGNLVEKWTIPTRLEDHGSHLLSDVVDAIRAKMEERSLTWDVVEGVGMGVPGPVDQDGTVMRCVNLGWDILNVPKAVQELEPAIEKLKVANVEKRTGSGRYREGGQRCQCGSPGRNVAGRCPVEQQRRDGDPGCGRRQRHRSR